MSISKLCLLTFLLLLSAQATHPQYIEGCLAYSQGKCLQCQYNYAQNGPLCYYSPTQSLDCCDKFGSQSKCVSCSKGLIFDASSQLCLDYKIMGCIQKNQKGCVKCASNYQQIGNICVDKIEHCTQYNPQDFSCVSCHEKTVLAQGNCVPLIIPQKPQNCQAYNELGCFKCNKGFWLNPTDRQCHQGTINGCLKYDGNGKCQTCQQPYFQLVKGLCGVVGCTKYTDGSCSSCNQWKGFTLHQAGVCFISNCVYFSVNGCELCKNGLIPFYGKCVEPSSLEETVCVVCKNSQFLDKNGVCQNKQTNCIKYNSGVCIECVQYFYLNTDSQCQPKKEGCEYQNGVCQRCYPPFNFVQGRCVIEGCTQYDFEGCLQCQGKLVLNNRICILPNCKYIENGQCVECISGYELDCNLNCVSVDPYCIVKNSHQVCLKCKEGYQLNNQGRCVHLKFGCNYVDGRCTSCRTPFTYVPESETCMIDGCKNYFIGGCSQCVDGYQLRFNSCKLPNCLISQNGKCLECDPDYTFNAKKLCVSKDEYCQKFNSQGKCIECRITYYMSKKLNRCVKKDPGCHYDDQDICISCTSPFKHLNNKCNIEGCLQYEYQGCKECIYPYQLKSNKTCGIPHCLQYNQGYCTACQQGYVLNQKKLCSRDDPYCLTYNLQRTECSKCIKGYKLDSKGKCQFLDEHCYEFGQNDFCLNCDRLYYVSPHGKCQIRDPHCLTYVMGFCLQCKPHFYSNQGICFPNAKGCIKQSDENTCHKCEKGYQLSKGKCLITVTKLTWNSIDMDFGFGEQDTCFGEPIFTQGINNKLNLLPVLSKNIGKVFYSSSSLQGCGFQIESQGYGWHPKGAKNEYIGVISKSLETYYAIDIKLMQGNKLTSFELQYSHNGNYFISIGSFNLAGTVVGATKTFYFKPVQAQAIRLVATSGKPHFKFDFYVSDKTYNATKTNNKGFISTSIVKALDGSKGGIESCTEQGTCWVGLESCQPKSIKGFEILYKDEGQKENRIEAFKTDYSTDGVTYVCWNSCEVVKIPMNNQFLFHQPIFAEKLRLSFTKVLGKPRFGVKFLYA